jgi:type IV secretion system protein TrbI
MPANLDNGSQDNTTEPVSSKDRPPSFFKKPVVNKQIIQLALIGVGTLVMIATFIAFTPHKPKPAQAKDKGQQQFAKQIPSSLDLTPEDYARLKAEAAQPTSFQPYAVSRSPVGSVDNATPLYQTYTPGPTTEQQVAFPDEQQAQPTPTNVNQQPTAKASPLSFSAFSPNNSADEETKRRLAALTSGFFFSWTSADQQMQAAKQKAAAAQDADAQAQAQANAISSAYESPYSKQNMAQEKQTFLAKQQADYSAYLDNHYLSPVDAAHMLMASTEIPITMITAINSDLPGEILAQVNENVFDSLSGQNILIPRGSRLIGTYDNSVAFGQDRVLVVWNRLIRTDGISISLRGMKGTDLQGKSGLHDQVDFHLAQILAAVGASTAFNVATNAAIAAMSTNKFLSSLATAMTAQGSSSSNVTSAATAAATAYANKLVDQQPTIVIREGTRAYCLIDKDMILPSFVDQDGGYMPSRPGGGR